MSVPLRHLLLGGAAVWMLTGCLRGRPAPLGDDDDDDDTDEVDRDSDTDAPLEPDCTSAADCDDGLACNGLETCSDAGVCGPGTPPCPNPDAVHCDVACTEGPSGAECGVTARDADQDGYGDEACDAAPGGDCDDTWDAINPGATEVCDGFDNDCNGLADVDDGLPLYTVSATINDSWYTSVAYSPTDQAYGVVYRPTQETSWRLVVYNEDGSVRAAPRPFSDRIDIELFPPMTLRWGDTDFAGFFTTINDEGPFLRRVDTRGLFEDEQSVGTSDEATDYAVGSQSSDPGYVVVWRGADENDLQLRLLDEDGTASDGPAAVVEGKSFGGGLSVAQSNATIAVAWRERVDQITRSQLTLLDDTLAEITSVALSDIAEQAQVAAFADGFAVAYAESDDATERLRFEVFDRTGTRTCGPLDLTNDEAKLLAFDAREALAAVYAEVDDALVLYRIDQSCQVLSDAAVIETSADFNFSDSADIELHDRGIAISSQVWDTSFNSDVTVRMLGPNLCDAPQ